jgi:hypothetical protein
MYKEMIKSYLGDEKIFDETPMRGRKASFDDSRTKKRVFETMTLPHIDALYGVALKLTRDRGDAENLVQDTFLRAFRFFDRYTMGTLPRLALQDPLQHLHQRLPPPRPRRRDGRLGTRELPPRRGVPQVGSPLRDRGGGALPLRRPVPTRRQVRSTSVPTSRRRAGSWGTTRSRNLDIRSARLSRIFRGRRLLRALLHDYGRANGYVH